MGLFNVKEENLAAAAGALSLSFLSLIPWVPSCKFQFQWRLRLLYYMAATERREREKRRPANTFISPQNNHRRLLLCCLTRCARTAPFAPTHTHVFKWPAQRHESRPTARCIILRGRY